MSPLKNFLRKELIPLVMPQKEPLCTSDLGPRKSQDALFFFPLEEGCRCRMLATGIFLLNPSEVLLLNSCVLLASRVSITWAHHSFMERNWKHILETPFITIASCLCLTLLQASEYYETSFTISDGLSGSTFFVATGFRGLHVILGSTSLIVWFFTSIKIPFHIQPPLWLRSCCLSFDPRISSSSFLYKIIFSSHYISFLWFRNCTPLSTPLSIMNVI